MNLKQLLKESSNSDIVITIGETIQEMDTLTSKLFKLLKDADMMNELQHIKLIQKNIVVLKQKLNHIYDFS